MEFVLSELCEQVMTAHAGRKPLFICGGGSKAFYGNRHRGEGDGHNRLDLTAYRGVIDYQPSELVVTVRAGTPLAEVEQLLAGQGQMLAFEPPHYGPQATVGGCVAAGLSGPRRAAAGSVRDFVLGTRLLDAQGRMLGFGGEVMKNVAGYDVSRLLTGSLGIFGAILEVSLKVAPRPLMELTLRSEATEAQAIERFGQWRSRPLPVSAGAWVAGGGTGDRAGGASAGTAVGGAAGAAGTGGATGELWVRLSGAEPAVRAAAQAMGGDAVDDAQAAAFWQGLREQAHPFFAARPLWRVAVPPTAAPLGLGRTLLEWGGGQRWVAADLPAQAVREAAARAGGHATLFRPADGAAAPADGVFHPLSAPVAAITRRLKQEFDPAGLFNPDRMVPGL